MPQIFAFRMQHHNHQLGNAQVRKERSRFATNIKNSGGTEMWVTANALAV